MAQKTINVTLAVTYSYDENSKEAQSFEAIRDINASTDKGVEYADYVQESVVNRVIDDVTAHMHTIENGIQIEKVWAVDDFEVITD